MTKIVQIILGTKCNLRCTYCYQHYYSYDNKIDNLTNIISTLDSLNYDKIGVGLEFIGGETLLFLSELKKIVSYFLDKNISILFIDVITNGTLFKETQELINFLLDKNLLKKLKLGVSLDGLISKHRVDAKGEPVAPLVIKNINKTLHHNQNIEIIIRGTVTKENYEDFFSLVKMFDKEKRVKFKAQWDTYQITNKNDFDFLLNFLKEEVGLHFKDKLKSHSVIGSKLKSSFFFLNKKQRENLAGIKELQGCGAFNNHKKKTIRYDGTLVACNGDLDGFLLNNAENFIKFNKMEKCKECEFKTGCSVCLVSFKDIKEYQTLKQYPTCFINKYSFLVKLTNRFFNTKGV